jgi:hypothetical protein
VETFHLIENRKHALPNPFLPWCAVVLCDGHGFYEFVSAGVAYLSDYPAHRIEVARTHVRGLPNVASWWRIYFTGHGSRTTSAPEGVARQLPVRGSFRPVGLAAHRKL